MSRDLVAAVAIVALCLGCRNEAPTLTSASPSSPRPPQADPAPSPFDAAPAEEPTARAIDAPLVEVATRIPDAVVRIRYATTDNFVGKVVSPDDRCWLRPKTADKLAAAATALRTRGYRLLLWDCYRPFSVQERLAEVVGDPRYVAPPRRDDAGVPVSGSRHNMGAAIDLSLADENGAELAMPTAYDDFSAAAHRSRLPGPGDERARARALEAAMHEAGFVGLATEWWHFDDTEWNRYSLLDLDMTKVAPKP